MQYRGLRNHSTRTWVCGIATLLMTCAWIEGAAFLAGHVKTTNSARALGLLFTANIPPHRSESSANRSMIPGMIVAHPHTDPNEQVAPSTREEQQTQILFVEGTVFVWENAMYGIGGLLTLTGLFSFRGRLGRPLHLAAGVIIILSTAVSLIAMILLTDPQRGGLQPLSIWNYLLVGISQSVYGIILLAVFWRRDGDGCLERPFDAQ